ncbi:MAG: amidohydrolase [Phycisphaerales bacterium]|nr:amidohydrolase [Phycisphaerales bacterium]
MPLTVDLHTHILPERWPDLAERYGCGGWLRMEHPAGCACGRLMLDDAFFREVAPNCWDPGHRVADCDAAGVDVQVLSTVPVMFSYHQAADHAADLSRFLNDHMADVVHTAPNRFVGLGTLPMQDSALAIAELERCIQLGLAGVQIGTTVNGEQLDHPQHVDVLEAAAELGACVFVHPWDMDPANRMPRHWLKWLVGMPAETAAAIASVLMGGVIERCPSLRIGFAHGGGAAPLIIDRWDHGHAVRPDLCQTATSTLPGDLLRSIYVDSLVHSETALRLLLDRLGPDRIALGTDYPFPLGELEPGTLINGMDLDAATTARLLGGTALEFLGDGPAARLLEARA